MKISLAIPCLLFAILGAGCTHLSRIYDAVAPPVQYDHEESEFGLEAAKRATGATKLNRQEGTGFTLQQPKKLDLSRKTYLILQVDGGGIMGITPAILVSDIEAALRRRDGFEDGKLNEVLSVCSGTSTGAIIVGAVAAGVPGEEIAGFYKNQAYDLFQSKGQLPLAPILQHKLNREVFQKEMIATLETHSDYKPWVRLGEMKPAPSIILASYDLVSKRTVFLRNQPDLDGAINGGEIKLIDAISASALSAAVFFGKLPGPSVRLRQLNADGRGYEVNGAIFADGGQGTQNTTIALAALEGLRIKQADPEAQIVLISLGCGNDFGERDFDEVLQFRGIDQVTDFLFRNQARSESILLQWMAALKIEEIMNDFKVFRFDWHHTNGKDATAFSITPRQRQFLIDKAAEIEGQPTFQQLIRDLSDDRLRIAQYRR